MAVKRILIVLLASTLGACASLFQSGIEPTDFTLPADWEASVSEAAAWEAPSVDPDIEVQAAIDLLASGKAKQARPRLVAALDVQPGNTRAASLLRQIDQDPIALLGAWHSTYRVRAGDTLVGIARAQLGDPLLFYALSRYNDLYSPALVKTGEVLKIPARAGSPVKRPARAVKPKAMAKPVRAASPSSPPLRAAAINTEAAKALKLEGLRMLNRGEPEPAATLFQQALAQDPADPSLRRHLAAALDMINTASARTLRREALQALNTGDALRAQALLERAAVLAPRDPTIARELARARQVGGSGGGR